MWDRLHVTCIPSVLLLMQCFQLFKLHLLCLCTSKCLKCHPQFAVTHVHCLGYVAPCVHKLRNSSVLFFCLKCYPLTPDLLCKYSKYLWFTLVSASLLLCACHQSRHFWHVLLLVLGNHKRPWEFPTDAFVLCAFTLSFKHENRVIKPNC